MELVWETKPCEIRADKPWNKKVKMGTFEQTDTDLDKHNSMFWSATMQVNKKQKKSLVKEPESMFRASNANGFK